MNLKLFLLACSASVAIAAPGARLVLVGDSTVTDNAGWGLGFRQFLADGATLTNTARGGRSSMSFINEGSWAKALALKGDYYLIQFGHNDEPGKPGRSTTPEEYRQYMSRYVDDCRQAGAVPVLVTSLVRRQFDRNDPHKINSSLEPRAEIVSKIAREKNVPLVELHDRSKELCEKLGKDVCHEFSPEKAEGQYDGTHLKGKGYVMFGRIVAEELRKAVPELSPLILTEPKNQMPEPEEKSYGAVVAFDGSGTHSSVQAAINAAPAAATAQKPFRILVKSGIYQEHVVIPAKARFIELTGEPGEERNTVIRMGTNVKSPDPSHPGMTLSASDSSTVLIDGSDITCRHLTFENTTSREERVQALACFIRSDRVAMYSCRFLGWQDTLRCDSCRQYFRECHLEGHVDFIYAAGTAVFDHCDIHSKADGFITAASTVETTPFGFVFLDCRITTGPGVESGVYLGRPWRPFAHTAFIRCELDGKIRPEGWHNWGKVENESTARYYESGSTGPGANPEARVAWARKPTSAEAAKWTAAAILAGDDAWNPAR